MSDGFAEDTTFYYPDHIKKLIHNDAKWLSNQLAQLSPLNRPEMVLLMSLQVMALTGGVMAYPYHLLTRKNFGERYVSLLSGFMYLCAIAALAGTVSSILMMVAVAFVQLMSGAWIITLLLGMIVFVAFFVQRQKVQERKKAGIVFYSRYAGTPIIWEKYLQNRCSLSKFKLVVEPIALLVLSILILILALCTGWYLLLGFVNFLSVSAFGTFLPEFYRHESQVNQLLDMVDEQENSRLQQEAMQLINGGKPINEIMEIDKTQSFESVDRVRRYADQFEKARKVREGAKV